MYIILNKYNFCIKALISYSYYSLQLCNYEIINDSNIIHDSYIQNNYI